MSEHLSAEQISNRMIGGRTRHFEQQAEQHVRDCPQCRAELARLEETLAQFRGSVRSWSDRQAMAAAPVRWKPGRGQSLRWALALAAMSILAGVPIYRNAADRRREAQQARADAILLEQVDAALSRTVPAPMEPLAKLVLWKPEKGEKK